MKVTLWLSFSITILKLGINIGNLPVFNEFLIIDKNYVPQVNFVQLIDFPIERTHLLQIFAQTRAVTVLPGERLGLAFPSLTKILSMTKPID